MASVAMEVVAVLKAAEGLHRDRPLGLESLSRSLSRSLSGTPGVSRLCEVALSEP